MSTQGDDLTDRITAALRSRQPDDARTAATADRIAGDLAAELAAGAGRRRGVPLPRHAGRIAATGTGAALLVTGLGVGAAAAQPYSGFAAGVEQAAHTVGLEWSFMPAGYTREQYDAFWRAGYTPQDVDQLAVLWHLDRTATKSRAGQALLDHQQLPVQPGGATATTQTSASDEAADEAFVDAGYTAHDVDRLGALWHTGFVETKSHAGRLLLEGKSLPIGPPTHAPSGR